MSTPGLTRDELVDDRKLEASGDDAFGHVDFVDELAGLALSVKTPANIALYGPWGSGKSSLGNLLKKRFKDEKRAKFVRFDALKYAEDPLLRQFLTQVASQLKVKDVEKYTRRLYETETRNDLDVSEEKFRRIAKLFARALGWVMGLVFFCAALYAVAAKGGTWERFVDALGWLAPKAFVPAVILGAVSTLVGNQFKTEHKREPLKTNEEFEEAFRAMVDEQIGRCTPTGEKKINDEKRRLVVFVDELDRCSPVEVAGVLETLRTFLEVHGCVFIVAADQHALEEALSRRVKQATPSNVTAPYYSAGSAYLDKIFQFQMALPPLKPQRLTAYALGLVENKPGVWQRISSNGELGDVISVLIPTHVDSPRRVKALLNHFALLYRIAEVRAARGQLASNIPGRAVELAKLACLRLEFPLFAADLTLDHRLPDLVHRCHKKQPLPKGLEEDVKERVSQWANGDLPVDELLIPDEKQQSEDDGDDLDKATVQQNHVAQLLRYLQKTSMIDGPGRDLVHLESAGAQLEGLDPAIADDLERAAIDGDRDRVAAAIKPLDPAGQKSAFRLLAYLVQHSTVGIEGRNVIGALLGALSVKSTDLAEVADEAAAAIASHAYELTVDDLEGALSLSLETSRAAGRELRNKVLSAEAILREAPLRQSVVRASKDLLADHRERVGEVLVAGLTDTPRATVEHLVALEGSLPFDLLDAAKPLLAKIDQEDSEFEAQRDQLKVAFDGFRDSNRRDLLERYATVLLQLRDDALDGYVHNFWQDLRSSTNPDMLWEVLDRIPSLAPDEAPGWLAMIDPRGIASDEKDDAGSVLAAVAAEAWRAYGDGRLPDSHMEELCDELAPYKEAGVVKPYEAVTDAITGAGQRQLAGGAGAVTQHRQKLANAERFEALGFIAEGTAADLALRTVGLSVNGQPLQQLEAMREPLIEMLHEYYQRASDAALIETREKLQAVVDGIWQGRGQVLGLQLAAELKARGSEEGDGSPYPASEIRDLLEHHSSVFEPGLVVWIDNYVDTAEELIETLDPLFADAPSSAVAQSIRELAKRWRADREMAAEHAALLAALLNEVVTRDASPEWLRCAELARAGAETVEQMISLYAAGLTVEQCGSLLNAWQLMASRDPQVQGRFVGQVLLPMASSSGDEYQLVVDRLAILQLFSPELRKQVVDALRATAKARNEGKDLEESLERAGLKQRSGLLGIKRDA